MKQPTGMVNTQPETGVSSITFWKQEMAEQLPECRSL
jgi:hypothetical protein